MDIEIITDKGELVEMSMAVKDWCCVKPELCLTACDLIGQIAQQNRKRLAEVMRAYEFINYPTEWWHFSYGDRYWAYHQPIKQALYGTAEYFITCLPE